MHSNSIFMNILGKQRQPELIDNLLLQVKYWFTGKFKKKVGKTSRLAVHNSTLFLLLGQPHAHLYVFRQSDGGRKAC